jgi:hypothetical protein
MSFSILAEMSVFSSASVIQTFFMSRFFARILTSIAFFAFAKDLNNVPSLSLTFIQ